MRAFAFILIGLMAVTSGCKSVTVGKKYSGKTVVVGLGSIAFPAGEWSLELQRIQAPTNDFALPDYFVFRKAGGQVERITFLRYPPTITPLQLGSFLDTVGESMGDGIPYEAKKVDGGSGANIYPMRMEPDTPKPTSRSISFSFLDIRPSPAPSWLCHSFLFFHDGCVFVMAHSSVSVISPETVGDVQFHSQFFPSGKPARDYK